MCLERIHRVSYFYFLEDKVKFRIWSENKRLLERVFDAGLLLLFIGIIIGKGGPARDLRCFGTLLLGWCGMSKAFQWAGFRNSVWSNIGALIVLFAVVCLIAFFMTG